jgi:hypothetical protein
VNRAGQYLVYGADDMGSERLRLLNGHERLTFEEIKKVTDKIGVSVYPKVRIADVLRIDRSGLSNEEYTYSLKAHFDFVVCNSEDMPEFSVEFDGPTHAEEEQHRKDILKNTICRRFNYPLLRINTNYLNKQYMNDVTLLAWIIDVHYLELAFYEEQKKGQVPYDEPFDPFLMVSSDASTRLFDYPYWLSADVRVKVQRLAKTRKVQDLTSSGFIGYDAEHNLCGIEFIRINDGQGICVESGLQRQNFPGRFFDLFSEILFVQLFKKIEDYLATGRHLEPLDTIYDRVKKYKSTYTLACSHSCGYSPS